MLELAKKPLWIRNVPVEIMPWGIYGFKTQVKPLRKWVSSRSVTREIHPFLGLIKV
jgi:hypothetical protein